MFPIAHIHILSNRKPRCPFDKLHQMPRPHTFAKIPFVLMLALAFSACGPFSINDQSNNGQQTNSTQPAHSAVEYFGNVSNSGNDPNNFLIVGDDASFSYNNDRGTLNWTTWKTTETDLGDRVERPDFRPDPRLPAGMKRIISTDYSGSGFDRGHMLPAADRFGNVQLMDDTFLMTNIVPQARTLNQYPWQNLESYVRAQVRRGFDAFQIAGVYGNAGVIKRKVTIPTNCWKIVILVPSGSSISGLDRRARVIAVDMPNRDGLEHAKWQTFTTTIRDIENKTGYDFLNYIPKDVQDGLENRVEMRSPNR
jgi:endonuclease G